MEGVADSESGTGGGSGLQMSRQCRLCGLCREMFGHRTAGLPAGIVADEGGGGCGGKTVCACCLDVLSEKAIAELAASVRAGFATVQASGASVELQIDVKVRYPPMLDALRIAMRTAITGTGAKQFPLPSLEDTIKTALLPRLDIPAAAARFHFSPQPGSTHFTEIVLDIPDQIALARAIFPEFKCRTKRKRRLPGEAPIEHEFEVGRTDADSVISFLKTLDGASKAAALIQRLLAHFWPEAAPDRSILGSSLGQRHWVVDFRPYPVYLLGRYRKLARDIPQSPWTIGEERKGRLSVEEIISDAVGRVLGAKQCKLHGCGREDIDVRCLGNGRPFVMEISDHARLPTEALLAQVLESLRNREGLNSAGDVEVPLLKLVDHSVWENMQAIAEEKKKAYCCVVWCEKPIAPQDLRRLEELSSSVSGRDSDEGGDCPDGAGSALRCIRVEQKTPLRVLHRRSLLTRVRYFYDIETAYLNEHFFLMKVVTSAGAYVKEFVHGDLGRTSPSISSLLNSNADILQLDVIGLFDDFEGGFKHLEHDVHQLYRATSPSAAADPAQQSSSLTWPQLQELQLRRPAPKR